MTNKNVLLSVLSHYIQALEQEQKNLAMLCELYDTRHYLKDFSSSSLVLINLYTNNYITFTECLERIIENHKYYSGLFSTLFKNIKE